MDSGSAEPTEAEVDPWQAFEVRLGAYLSTMIDPDDEDALVVHVPTSRVDGEADVEVTTLDGGTQLRIDFGFDVTGCAVAESATMAWRICETIRYRFAPPHPGLMTVWAVGPASCGVGVLALPLTSEVPREDDADDDVDRVFWPQDRDELTDLVLCHLRDRTGEDLALDDDGDVAVVVDGVGLWVRVEPSAPMLHLFTQVVEAVHSRRQAGIELNVVNRDHRWSRWVRRERTVWQELHVPAYPFVPRTFDAMLDGFAVDHQRTGQDLADRLGGRLV